MSRPLPPLNALRAFEATARHLSFTRAADELSVTPAALSHQIRGLEDYLGHKLFHRHARSISLTPAGELLFPGLNAAFVQIRQTVDRLDVRRDGNVLVVSAPPGFTAKWLAPRLHRFLADRPEMDVRVSATQGLANFTSDGVDLAIRNGTGPFPGLWSERILDIALHPVVAPRLVEELGPITSPRDIARFPMIHDDSLGRLFGLPTWADWLKAAGIDGIDLTRGVRFSSADHAIEAAIEGAGMLLSHRILTHDDVRLGRLVAPFELSIPATRAFHLVFPSGRENVPKIAAFREWVLAEIARVGLACTAPAKPPPRRR